MTVATTKYACIIARHATFLNYFSYRLLTRSVSYSNTNSAESNAFFQHEISYLFFHKSNTTCGAHLNYNRNKQHRVISCSFCRSQEKNCMLINSFGGEE